MDILVREVISMSLPDSYWVEAELSEAREGYGGHCYLHHSTILFSLDGDSLFIC